MKMIFIINNLIIQVNIVIRLMEYVGNVKTLKDKMALKYN